MPEEDEEPEVSGAVLLEEAPPGMLLDDELEESGEVLLGGIAVLELSLDVDPDVPD